MGKWLRKDKCVSSYSFITRRFILSVAYKLNEDDFNRSIGDWRGHWIIISVEFDEISNDESIQSLFIHGSGVIEEDRVKKPLIISFLGQKQMLD